MQDDRRDYGRRGETMRRVVEQLVRGTYGVELRSVAAGSAVTPEIAQRIVKRLALLGLVRAASGRWLPREVLRHAAPLQRL